MVIKTGRFGQLTVGDDEIITIPQGVFGFPEYTKYCLVDPGDDTLILWLQSTQNPDIAFALLEPKIFKPDYAARLSAQELRELKLENIHQSVVFSILTIPENVAEMSANLKAPIVINLREHLGRQVVLQESEYVVRHPMFRELRAHLITIASQRQASAATTEAAAAAQNAAMPVSLKDIPPSLTVRALSV